MSSPNSLDLNTAARASYVQLSDGTTAIQTTASSSGVSYATITASTSGATTIVSGVDGKKILVLGISLISNSTVNVKFQSHTAPTDLTGLYYLAANTGFVMGYSPVGWFQTLAGEALDINLSGNIAVGGVVVYTTL